MAGSISTSGCAFRNDPRPSCRTAPALGRGPFAFARVGAYLGGVIHLNNAATTWPKPEPAYRAVDEALRGRPGAVPVEECRRDVAAFLGIADPARLAFLPGATYAANLAILGLPWERGDVAVMSGLEHHAVSRPIRRVARERGVRFEVAPYRVGVPIDLGFVEEVLRRGRVRLVACMLASNVTGEVLPVAEVVALAHRYGALALVDAAQAAGIVPVDVAAMGADLVAFAGHKALFGPPGVGGLYAAPTAKLDPLAVGGTGHDSGSLEPSGDFEVGTQNLPAIAGLAAGVRWIRETGAARLRERILGLTGRLLEGLAAVPGVTVYGTRDLGARTAAVSITAEGWAPKDLAARLLKRGIVVRAGFHCAPLAHETIGTLAGGGTVRLSAGYWTTEEDIDQALAAIGEAAQRR